MGVWWIWLDAVLVVYIAQLAAVFFMEHRRPSQLTAWLLIVFVCPYIGFIAYLFLAKDFVGRRRVKRFKNDATDYADQISETVSELSDIGNKQLEKEEKLYAMLVGLAPFPITRNNEVLVLTNGHDTYEAMLGQLEQAVHHIHMDYYTIRADEIGRRFAEVLARKAREGVEVRIVYDGIGSMKLSEPYLAELHLAGVQTSCFLPPRIAFFDRRLNYRNHRKIVVVDGKVGFVGGINIGDEYIGGDPKLGFWRDTHLCLKGDSVYYLQELFMNDWSFAAKEELGGKAYMPTHQCEGDERVLIVSSKPGRYDQKIAEVMFAAITAARSRIYLTTPYFIPDSSLLMGLRTAALSGVDVRLIIPGIADSKLVLLATLSYIQELLEAGVKVYRYEKGFIHAKVMIIDQMLATVGTANVDMRSLYSNFELNAVLFDEHAIKRLEADFMEDLRDSRELDFRSFLNRPKRQKLKESLLHILSPLL
ncbi:cardiolipin synthase [Paenibacillus sp. FSL H8-0548]|uniref:cardiolipin synthase n=1 Tax=Paenibacillus sp. FSL H8-0548 TaxID=1920422 RepID=UPI00096BFB65|nr:cardiolipin synthase [Paenibacillus sp. FSL H8-0548]OMF30843.1 cardiolipin synthase [Paenibacillus sp. FSL H8-0548]